jgi:hypothetical protein
MSEILPPLVEQFLKAVCNWSGILGSLWSLSNRWRTANSKDFDLPIDMPSFAYLFMNYISTNHFENLLNLTHFIKSCDNRNGYQCTTFLFCFTTIFWIYFNPYGRIFLLNFMQDKKTKKNLYKVLWSLTRYMMM